MPKQNAANEDVNIRDIANFWEKQTSVGQDEQEEEDLSKRWTSMPDLKTKINRAKQKKKKKKRSEENVDDEELRMERIRAEARRRIDLVRSGRQSPDDRGVCTGLFSDRKRLFEDIARQDMRQRQRQWASMPSLDKKEPPSTSASSSSKNEVKDKDRYFPYQSAYGRHGSQLALNHKYDPTKSPFSGENVETREEVKQMLSTSRSNIAETGHDRPIPLVSANSREVEDFELVPLRDRMRRFQSTEQEPVTKPAVSVPRTISAASSNTSRKSWTPKPPMAKSPSLDLEAEPPLSLTESIASSHTSSSTVISASKINGYNVNRSASASDAANKVVATYSYNDESNGEIYNDDVVNTEDATLYVVENGKEFPLTSVSQRKSFFQEREKKLSSASLPNDILQSEPRILGRKETMEFHRQQETQYCSDQDEAVEEEEEESTEVETEVETDTDTVKSSQAPYIRDEQDVLANIKVVKALKQKFTASR